MGMSDAMRAGERYIRLPHCHMQPDVMLLPGKRRGVKKRSRRARVGKTGRKKAPMPMPMPMSVRVVAGAYC